MTTATLVKNSAIPAAIATATTTAAVTGLTKLNEGSASAGLNAVSHILWGDAAQAKDEFSAKYTLVGAGLNSAAVASWAAVHELVVEKGGVPRRFMPMLLTASLVSGIAYLVDYHVVPERLTPGFEKRLTPKAMAIVYGALAVGLAVGAVLVRKRL
jgi:hypothetical protein